MNKKMVKNVLLFGAGLYLGATWTKAKIMDALIDGAEERKRPIDYKTYESRRHKEKKECNTNYKVYTDTEFIFSNRKDAEEILDKMNEVIAVYGHVTLADMCDLVGTMPYYTDNKKGWIDIRKACVVKVKEGYKIIMPKTIQFEK